MKNTDSILAARMPRKATEGDGAHTILPPILVAVAITTCLKLIDVKWKFQLKRCIDVTAVKPMSVPAAVSLY